ncbi:hypothetical protein [Ruminococcus sp.]|uniref:hypothetical protein n=1 Tax=Ruminococcus sp. TaxID=41978 RepID=UPI0025D1812D|nr:hypothetical protein [Ruminococcus sp.]MBQ8967093.1 hypothetical protein [Ruminococcus sp.]
MKKNVFSVMAAGAAVMAAMMFASCGDLVVNSPDAETVGTVVSAMNEQAAPEIKTAPAAKAPAAQNSTVLPASQATTTTTSAAAAQAPAPAVQAQAPAQTSGSAQAAPAVVTVSSTQQTAPAEKAESKPAETKAAESKAATVNTADFAGHYVENSQKVATMDVTDNGNGNYSVHIEWAVTANEYNSWDFTGDMDSTGKLSYLNCRKSTAAFDDKGNYTVGVDGLQTPFTTYTAGAGSLQITSYGVVWEDGMGDIYKGTTFVKQDAKGAPAPKAESRPAEVKAPESKAAAVSTANFAGHYVENSQKVATMDVTDNGNGNYNVHIEWAVNANEFNSWDFTGSMDSTGKLSYLNCRKTTSAFDANGNYTVGVDGLQTPFTTYTAGAGSLQITSYGVVWEDGMGDIFKGTTFVK